MDHTKEKILIVRTAIEAADAGHRRVRRWWWLVLRMVIDVAALYVAGAIQFAASGSYAAAFITAAAVGLYGLWCFYDGSS